MCKAHSFRGRQAGSIENNDLRVTVLKEGGHIAEILDKRSGVNPLWIPPWTSIEPSDFNPLQHTRTAMAAMPGSLPGSWAITSVSTSLVDPRSRSLRQG